MSTMDQEKADKLFADMRTKITEAFAAEFQARPELHSGGAPQVAFQMIYASALIDFAAGLAVDAGMTTAEPFEKIAGESFKRTYQSWPKFG